MAAKWIDLLDPTAEELHNGAPCKLQESAIELLLAEPKHEDDPRPTLQGHGEYVFGILIIPVELPDADELFYQQVDLVVTADAILTVLGDPALAARLGAEGRRRVREEFSFEAVVRRTEDLYRELLASKTRR